MSKALTQEKKKNGSVIMSIDIINDEDNFLKLLGDEEEDLSQNDDLLYMEIPNFNPVPSDGSDSGKTDDDSSVSGTNEVSGNTSKFFHSHTHS